MPEQKKDKNKESQTAPTGKIDELIEMENRYKRALADYQNHLKQSAKEKAEFGKFANEHLLMAILPVYDNLKMSLAHAKPKDHDNWLTGINCVIKQFTGILNDFGVSEIEAAGKEFDPNIMEAINQESTTDEKLDNHVAKVIQSGYVLNNKVIKAAKVAVYKLK